METVNKETHSLEEEAPDASTATRMVKAMYSVSRHPSESPGAAERRRTGHWPSRYRYCNTKGKVTGETHARARTHTRHIFQCECTKHLLFFLFFPFLLTQQTQHTHKHTQQSHRHRGKYPRAATTHADARLKTKRTLTRDWNEIDTTNL